MLKLLGLKLIRTNPRRKKAIKWTGRLVTSIANPEVGWENLPDNPPNSEWKTHYVGDDCPGGHRDLDAGYEAKKLIVTQDAAFVPVDIGADEQKAQQYDQNKKQ